VEISVEFRNNYQNKEENIMATIKPEGERVRQAVKWIAAEKMEDDTKSTRKLIQEAAMRFNLSPKEEMELNHFYQEGS
jgi:uncharacterized protein (DUF927 family)